MSLLAAFCVPGLLLGISILIFASHDDLFAVFSDGIIDGMRTTVKILPAMLLLTVAVRMLSASGALTCLCRLLTPLCQRLNMDVSLLPIVLLRPFSGSGATAMLTQLFAETTPESFASRAACILMGSSDTILYTLSVYFSSVGEKKTGRSLPTAFVVLIFCTVLSCLLTKVFFR